MARRVLDDEGEFSESLNQLTAGACDLKGLPELQHELMALCLTSLVERSIEGEHARIKAEARGRESTITPATLAAALRSPEVHAMLDDQLFTDWATSVWHKPLVVKKVLSFLLPTRQLLAKSLPAVYSLAYLYDRKAQHSDTEADSDAMTQWIGSVASKVAPKVGSLAWQEKLLVESCKAQCQAAGSIALPRSLIDQVGQVFNTKR